MPNYKLTHNATKNGSPAQPYETSDPQNALDKLHEFRNEVDRVNEMQESSGEPLHASPKIYKDGLLIDEPQLHLDADEAGRPDIDL